MSFEELLYLLSVKWFGISTMQLIQAAVLIILGFVVRRLFLSFLNKLIVKARQSRFKYDHLLLESLNQPLGWIPLLIFFYLASLVLPLPSTPIDLDRFTASIFRTSWILLIIWIGRRLFEVLCDFWAERASKTDTKLDDQLVPIIRKSGRVILLIVGGVMVFQNMGYSVGSLLASFGLGGAAIALASKDTLSNLFGSLVIFLDRPFQIGDWIEINDIEGTIEDVGLRSIKIRTFANSVIMVPNSFFTTSYVNNWSRMEKRRIKLIVGLTYGTPAEKIQAAVEAIKQIINDDEKLHQDFFLVNFVGFGSSSLDILVYCFTRTTDWKEFMNAQEAFLLKIMNAIEQLGLEFAFPTRTVHVNMPEHEPKMPFN